jgi:hypothetical protein
MTKKAVIITAESRAEYLLQAHRPKKEGNYLHVGRKGLSEKQRSTPDLFLYKARLSFVTYWNSRMDYN